tara:strand:+ start:555 stop:1400 length:846 start_codon:yes stop_codon:yes gene_type:complete
MIVWIASYPKSGNTWIRALLSSLIFTDDGIFSLDLLKKINQFPSRKFFKDFTNEYNNINEIKKYWISAQNKINSDKKLRLFKTHQANFKIDNYNFTNKENTLGTIYIVRDPRNIVTSLKHHYTMNLDEAKNFITTQSGIGAYSEKDDKKESNIATLLGSWSDHYNSWKKTTNLLLIKYEDLINNIDKELIKIIDFAQKFGTFEVNEKKINNVIKTTSFENLKKLEKNQIFSDAISDKNNKKKEFFYLGKKNKWETFLDSKTISIIEEKFKNEMIELGYLNT